MKRFAKIRKNYLLILVILLAITATGIFSYVRIIEIDISSGRIRKTTRIYFLNMNTEIEDTFVTKCLAWHNIRRNAPVWKYDSAYTLFNTRHSLPYPYHGVFYDLKMLEPIVFDYHISDDGKLKLALDTLQWLNPPSGNFEIYSGPVQELSLFIEKQSINPCDPDSIRKINEYIVNR